MSEEEKKRKLLEMWEKEQLANECVRQYLQYRKAKEYIDELEEIIDKAIEWVKKHINKYECKGITIIDWDELSNPNDLLEILGDKDGTSNN